MLAVTVKTLDAQNHDYTVADDITVKEFKEKIAPTIGITADKQRLIFCGRVLQDDKKLSEYDVNGKVIHLVQRPPPQQRTTATTSATTRTTTTTGQHRDAGSFLLGAFTIPQDMINPAQVEQIVQDVVSGMGEIGRNATVMSRTSEDGSSVDVHINLGHVPWQSAAQLRIQQSQNFLTRANQIIDAIENNRPVENGDAPVEGVDGARHLGRSSSDTQLNSASLQEPQQGEQDNSRRGPFGVFGRLIDTVVQASRAAVDATMQVSPPRANSAPERQERSRSAEDISTRSERQHQAQQQQQPQPPNQAASSGPREPNHPRTSALASVMDNLLLLQRRLEPHLERYRTLLRDDPEITDGVTDTQQFFSRISQVLHYLSHVHHSISDLSVSFGQAPPRAVRARLMTSIHPSAVIHAGFPLQAHLASARMATAGAPPTGTPPSSGTPHSEAPPTTGVNPSESSAGLGGIGAPHSIFSSENPVVFMEMGSGSIPFDSLVSNLPELIANASQAGQTNGGNQPTFGSATTVPTTSGSTGTRTSTSSSTPGILRAEPMFFFDPCLPCNSRWAAGSGQGQPRAAVSAQSRVIVPQQDDQLHQMIGGLMSALLQQPQTFSQSRADGARQPPMRLTDLLQQRTALSRAQADRVSAPTQQIRMPVGTFSDLVQAIDGATTRRSGFDSAAEMHVHVGIVEQMNNAASGQSTNTLADFLSSLTDYAYVEGESIVTDLIMCVAQNLTFQELMNIVFGRTEALRGLQSSLRHFITQRSESDLGVSSADANPISVLTTCILDQWQDSISAAAREANVKPGVDYQTTINNFLRNRIEQVFRLVIFCEEDGAFGSELYELCRTIISELILLNLECFEDREISLHRVIRGRIREVTSNVNPLVQSCLLHIANTEISAIISSARGGNILEHIVRTELPVSENRANAPVRNTPPVEANGGAATGGTCEEHKTEEAMVVDEVSHPETWHSAIPQEWVPVITRDVQRQRRHPQHPFSDAYLVGMPSKRRRIMAESQEVLRPVHSLLPQALQRAISSTHVQPVTSLDRVHQEVTQNMSLHTAYKEQVRSMLRDRLQNDLDYHPDRFPHAERYFNTE